MDSYAYLLVWEDLIMKYIYIALFIVELFAFVYMIYELTKILSEKIKKKWDKVLTRCANDVKYKNRIASIIFFFSDMGPNVSSFSIIALFITSEENGLILTVIFFAGIIIKEMSREFKNIFYSEIEKRSSQ